MKADKKAWFIAVIVVMLAVVEIIDMTIVSIALRDMQGALSATPNQITWAVTVYIVSAAIVMPMTGFLTARFGRKQLLVTSAFFFTGSSLLCGLSTSLGQLLVFRGLQGLFGALLPPLAQATLVDTFSHEDLPKAMALYGIGLMAGPIFGPILGGMITQHLGWRFIFYVNIPIGLTGAFLAHHFLPATPKVPRNFDYYGILLLTLCIGSLQFVLDKGNEDGWFQSNIILTASIFSMLMLIIFLLKGLKDPGNVIRFEIFRDKNFSLGCVAMFLYCAVMLGTLSWVPLMLELFLNYPPATAGFALAPRGLACLCVIALTPRLTKLVDSRYLIMCAALLYGTGLLFLSHFNLSQGPDAILFPNIIQGIATGLFFVPLNNLSYQSLPKRFISEAAGLINFFRSLGSSVGVAIFSTLMARQVQQNWNYMGQYVSVLNPHFNAWLAKTNLNSHYNTAIAIISNTVNNQAYALAFVHANQIFSVLILLVAPVVLCMTPRAGLKTPSIATPE